MAKRRSHTGVGRTILALSAICILVPSSRASAAKIDVTPSISLDQTYDSNVFHTNGNEKEDFILRVTPAVAFSLKMPETTLNLRTSLTSDTYYKYTERNSTSSAVTLALDAMPPLRITPRLSIAPSGHYVQARDSYLRNQLVPAEDTLQPASIATENLTRKTRDFGAAMRAIYLLTEKSEFSLGGGFKKRQFLDNVAGGIDSRVVTGDATLTYKFTLLLSSGFYFNTAYNTFENGRDSRTFSGGLTGTYLFSPALSMNARAGASRAQESDPTGLPDRTTWSPDGSLSLTYTGRDIHAAFTGSIGQSGGGSFGMTTRRQSVGLSFSDQFAQGWSADLSGKYQLNRSLDPAVSQDLASATGSAGVRYQPLEWATLHLSGTALRQWSNGSVGTDLQRYSGFLGVTLGKSFNIY